MPSFCQVCCLCQERVNSEQDDLDDDDVMLLDTYREIYVWVGAKASKKEKEKEMGLSRYFTF